MSSGFRGGWNPSGQAVRNDFEYKAPGSKPSLIDLVEQGYVSAKKTSQNGVGVNLRNESRGAGRLRG